MSSQPDDHKCESASKPEHVKANKPNVVVRKSYGFLKATGEIGTGLLFIGAILGFLFSHIVLLYWVSVAMLPVSVFVFLTFLKMPILQRCITSFWVTVFAFEIGFFLNPNASISRGVQMERSIVSPRGEFTAESPIDLVNEVGNAEPLRQNDVGNTFTGMKVHWILEVFDVEKISSDSARLVLSEDRRRAFSFHTDSAIVEADLPINGNEFLYTTKKGDMVEIEGTIKDVSSGAIGLKEASVFEIDKK